jgi:hypothetical protein
MTKEIVDTQVIKLVAYFLWFWQVISSNDIKKMFSNARGSNFLDMKGSMRREALRQKLNI